MGPATQQKEHVLLFYTLSHQIYAQVDLVSFRMRTMIAATGNAEAEN
jgi:hypothetical protein